LPLACNLPSWNLIAHCHGFSFLPKDSKHQRLFQEVS
jgi:hypothetical protein